MKPSISIFDPLTACMLLPCLFLALSPVSGSAQTPEPDTIRAVQADTAADPMNMDAMYNRPFLTFDRIPVAIGGYVEANSQYEVSDGISGGLSFQMRRLSIFLSSSIAERLHFLTEIEFEDGAREINLESAVLDIVLHPSFNVRGGVILNPIGSFKQNHDGPKWEFVDRPVSATRLLPATWSNAGAGIYGKFYLRKTVLAYEAYVTNGFDDRVISNEADKTMLSASKENGLRFGESANGAPLFTGKLSLRRRHLGEIGFSWMGGIYNTFAHDGLILDDRRWLHAWAVDLNVVVPALHTAITAEAAIIRIDVPESYSQQYGSGQAGGFIDFVQPVLQKPLFGFRHSVVNAALRVEYVDWNTDRLRETGESIADDYVSLAPAIGWRPVPQTVLRVNYRYAWQRDFLGNPASRTATFHVGLASYF